MDATRKRSILNTDLELERSPSLRLPLENDGLPADPGEELAVPFLSDPTGKFDRANDFSGKYRHETDHAYNKDNRDNVCQSVMSITADCRDVGLKSHSRQQDQHAGDEVHAL